MAGLRRDAFYFSAKVLDSNCSSRLALALANIGEKDERLRRVRRLGLGRRRGRSTAFNYVKDVKEGDRQGRHFILR